MNTYNETAILADYKAGMAAKAIAKKHKIKAGGPYVYSILKRNGVKPKRGNKVDKKLFAVRPDHETEQSVAPQAMTFQWKNVTGASNGNGILSRLSRVEASLARLEEVLA